LPCDGWIERQKLVDCFAAFEEVDKALHRYTRAPETGSAAEAPGVYPDGFIQVVSLFGGHIIRLSHFAGLAQRRTTPKLLQGIGAVAAFRVTLPIVKRPLGTWTQSATLASIFSVHTDKDLHALMERPCVLFEDLRIAVAGQVARNVDGLDRFCAGHPPPISFGYRRIAINLQPCSIRWTSCPFRPIRARFAAVAQKH
jgi:hypothetical protein